MDGPNESRPVALAARDLHKRYRLGESHTLGQTLRRLGRRSRTDDSPSFEALGGVTFEAYRGEAIGIVGTNGSGKSTFLQILAGTTLPSMGTMDVHGRVLPLLAVGAGFHSELTGKENVTLFATSLGIPRRVIFSRIDAVAAFAELERHMDTPVKRYSSGMLSRLSFAISMQFPADIYVFDEVLAVVDGEFQIRCLEEIRRLHAEGRTLIFISHDLAQVAAVCSRVMWLEAGKVRDVGHPDVILAGYAREHGEAPPT